MAAKGRKTNLSERERRFVEAFMGRAAGNGTKAAVLAGYSKKAAAQQASRLLRKANIRGALASRAENDPNVATREERQQLWSDIAFGRGEYAKAKLTDRLKASELLGKSQADFTENLSHRFPDENFTFVLDHAGSGEPAAAR